MTQAIMAGPLASRQAALAAAAALAPEIRERAEHTEAERVVPRETIAALRDSGLFGVVTPRLFGGSELGLAALVEVTAELAAACGSTGWVYGVLAGHSWLLNLFPEDAQREVHRVPDTLMATVFRLGGEVRAEGDGYRLTGGDGRFCSGIDHADWVIVGNMVLREDEPPEPRFFLIPRSDVEVIDDWFTAGMRGTGSRAVRIADAFIPAHRSVSVADLASGAAPGTALHDGALYRMSFADVTPFSIVGAPLGMARGMLDLAAAGLRRSIEKGGSNAPDQTLALAGLAEAGSRIDTAWATVLADAERIDAASARADISEENWRRIPRNWAFAVQSARAASNDLFASSGGGSVYATSPVQRLWRDVNVAAQHRAFNAGVAMPAYARKQLGLTAAESYALKNR